VPESYYEKIQENRKAKKGDIIYSVVGSYGIPVLIDFEREFCFQRHIAILKPHQHLIGKYLLFALKSRFVLDQATKVATGTTQLTVTLSGLRRIKIPLVSLPEQVLIVEKIETLFKAINRIEEQYVDAHNDLNQMLDRSILAKAFRGELVPQDPNDEPAAVLLERIRAERAGTERSRSDRSSTPKQRGKTTRKNSSKQLSIEGIE
jgi:type I restriction enzyme, S subunit